MRGYGWLGMYLVISLSLGLGVSAEAGSMPPHSIEKWLDKATDVIQGRVVPGGIIQQSYQCERPMGPSPYECPKTLIEVRVEEVLRGPLRPGDRITILIDEGLGMVLSISPRFEPDEPILVCLSDTHPSRGYFAVPRELQGRVYKVVGDMMGKWSAYSDGVLRRGPYQKEFRYQVPWGAEEVFGPNPPKEHYRTVTRDEYWKIMKQRSGVRSPEEAFEERWARGEAIPNEGELTLEQMRKTVQRHSTGVRAKESEATDPGRKGVGEGYEIREGLVVPIQYEITLRPDGESRKGEVDETT